MVAVLMKSVIDELKELDEPFKKLKEAGQKRVIKNIENGAKEAIEKAVEILAAEDRPSVFANVEKVAFGKGVALNLSATMEQLHMFDLANHKKKGGRVTIILIDNDVHGERMEGAPVADKDQKALPLDNGEKVDPLIEQAREFVVSDGNVSISSVQRKFRIGYNRAAKLVEELEKAGVVSAMASNGSREVLEKPKKSTKKKTK